MKTSSLLLICLLWMCSYSFAGNEPPDSGHAYLYIRIPSNVKLKKYHLILDVKYVINNTRRPKRLSPEIYRHGQLIKFEIKEGQTTRYEDSLVDVKFIVQSTKWGRDYYHHQVRLKITSDSVYYVIPELPDDQVIDAYMRENGTDFRDFKRKDDFVDFVTNWKSCLVYANFYQGHRPYGELSFSNARYSGTAPLLIRGPAYGAEFNFRWRKNDFILGPKVGFHITTRVFNLGLSGVYYTDFTHGLFCIKPRIGINPGIPWVSISYEYAIRCGYNYFGNRINSHQISVCFLIPLKLKQYGR